MKNKRTLHCLCDPLTTLVLPTFAQSVYLSFRETLMNVYHFSAKGHLTFQAGEVREEAIILEER